MSTATVVDVDSGIAESQDWIDALSAEGSERDRALQQLHELLLRAARFEVNRRAAQVTHLRGGDLDDLAQQAADDALVAVLRKLGDYRGLSRFTTWAYKFALYEAAAKVRRRAWQGRELPVEPEAWPQLASSRATPEREAEGRDLIAAVRRAIDEELSGRQRELLVSVALQGVPIDVLAERLGSTRGALYKMLHDARRKLRDRLARDGFDLEIFG